MTFMIVISPKPTTSRPYLQPLGPLNLLRRSSDYSGFGAMHLGGFCKPVFIKILKLLTAHFKFEVIQ